MLSEKRRKATAGLPESPAAGEALEPKAELLERLVAEGVSQRPEGSVARTGHLTGIDSDGRVRFRFEGEEGDDVPVTIGLDLPDGAVVKAARQQRRALVLRTGDPVERWVLVGFVRERVSAKARDAGRGRLELRIDGERVCFDAEHDLELRCGRARITLRYDGRIELHGTHILSASRGPNRVRGATVSLN